MKSVLVMITVYFREKILVENNKGKDMSDRVLDGSTWGLVSYPLPRESRTAFLPPSCDEWQYTHGIPLARKANSAFGVQTQYWSHTAYMADLESPVPLDITTDVTWPKAPIINHTVSLCSDHSPQPRTILLSGRAFQEPGDHLLGVEGKGSWGQVPSLQYFQYFSNSIFSSKSRQCQFTEITVSFNLLNY